MDDFDGVGEAAAEVVAGAAGEDLGLSGEAAEGAGLDDAVAVTLEGRAMRACWGWIDAGAEKVVLVAADGTEMKGWFGLSH